jgi:hypothetical protein
MRVTGARLIGRHGTFTSSHLLAATVAGAALSGCSDRQVLAAEEIAHRQQTRLARLTRRRLLSLSEDHRRFNTSPCQSSLRLQMLGFALAPDFITQGRSLILAGKPSCLRQCRDRPPFTYA